MAWWHYLLLVNLYLVLFFCFYVILLRKETFFQLNRVYLVAASILSFIIPSMQSEWINNLFITQRVHQTIYTAVNQQLIYQVKTADSPVTLGQVVACIYITSTLFLSLRLVYRLFTLKKILSNKISPETAFSFFNTIRVAGDIADKQTILSHEEVHARQWHSADVLLIEMVMIVNWFNPVVYYYRKAIKHVHEYIADRKAVQHGTSKADYALILLNQTFGALPHGLSNAFFNHSLLKQRLKMLNQNESQKRALLKYGLSAPLFAAMLIFSSATVNNSSIIKIINKETDRAFAINQTDFKDSLSKTKPEFIRQPRLITTTPNNKSPDKRNTIGLVTATGVAPLSDSMALKPAPVFNAVEIQPEFPGGDAAFRKFLNENIRYPDQAKENHVAGRVYIQFIIEKDGSLSDMKALRDPGSGLGEEAMRALTTSPKWHPGIQNGKTVRVQFTVPVNFTLEDEDRPIVNDSVSANSTPTKIMNILTARSAHPDSGARYNIQSNRVVSVTTAPRYNTPEEAVFLVDGKHVPRDEFNHLNPENIESVQVVKADSTKASNTKGTIYVKLKKAKN